MAEPTAGSATATDAAASAATADDGGGGDEGSSKPTTWIACAIRKSPKFEAPVIFLSKKDAEAFLQVEPNATVAVAAGAADDSAVGASGEDDGTAVAPSDEPATATVYQMKDKDFSVGDIEYQTFEKGLQDEGLYEYVLEHLVQQNLVAYDDDNNDNGKVTSARPSKRRKKESTKGRSSKSKRSSRKSALESKYHYYSDNDEAMDGRKQHLQRHIKQFDKEYGRLRKFKEMYGDTDVPTKKARYRVLCGDANNDTVIDQDSSAVKGLGTWVKSMRGQLKIYQEEPANSLLTKSQVQKLNDLDFCMEPKRGLGRKPDELKDCWDETKYEELVVYHNENGHCNVPKKPKSALRDWLDRVRLAYHDLKDGIVATITDEQITKLNALGIDWNEKRKYTFEENFERWKQYKVDHNGKDPSFGHDIYKWVSSIRTAYTQYVKGEKKGGLTHEQVKTLTQGGFLFGSKFENAPDLNARSFNDNFERWCEYKCQNPDGKDPPKGSKIHDWMQRMRSAYVSYCRGEKGRYVITPKQINILKVAGFYFPSEAKPNKPPVRRTHARNLTFEERLQELKEYKEKFGDCLVPNRYPSLGEFVKQTRKEYKKWNVPGKRSSMSNERYAKLVEIGFVFDAAQHKGGGGGASSHNRGTAGGGELVGGAAAVGGGGAYRGDISHDYRVAPVAPRVITGATAGVAAPVAVIHQPQVAAGAIPPVPYQQHPQQHLPGGPEEQQQQHAGMKRKAMDDPYGQHPPPPHHHPQQHPGGGEQQQQQQHQEDGDSDNVPETNYFI